MAEAFPCPWHVPTTDLASIIHGTDERVFHLRQLLIIATPEADGMLVGAGGVVKPSCRVLAGVGEALFSRGAQKLQEGAGRALEGSQRPPHQLYFGFHGREGSKDFLHSLSVLQRLISLEKLLHLQIHILLPGLSCSPCPIRVPPSLPPAFPDGKRLNHCRWGSLEGAQRAYAPSSCKPNYGLSTGEAQEVLQPPAAPQVPFPHHAQLVPQALFLPEEQMGYLRLKRLPALLGILEDHLVQKNPTRWTDVIQFWIASRNNSSAPLPNGTLRTRQALDQNKASISTCTPGFPC
ncbi:hypothetical protein INR49_011062 [Caranx melampygus]|nr:hypothetical protein INR49_011062 [Caranx melampygus]